MDKISLLNFAKTIPVAQIKRSEKLEARDIDEEFPNKFVAYVDEGNNSHDVSITINAKKEIIESTCDCENQNGFCIHKLALMRFLVTRKSKTATVKTTRQKKLTETEALLQNVDANALRIWAADLFKKNKDLEILFLNEFKISNTIFTIEEIELLILTAIKSIIKNKKNIDASQLKKTLDLLDSSLKPVMVCINSNIAMPKNTSLLKAVFDGLTNFEENVYINSIKTQRFIEKIGNEYLATLYLIKDFEIWKKVVSELFEILLGKGQNSYHLYHLNFVEQIYDKSGGSKEKNIAFVELYIDFLEDIVKSKLQLQESTYDTVLDMCVENNVFEKHSTFFKPLRYANAYNEKLLNLLIDNKKYIEAQVYAKKQIENNYYESYNIIYYKILKRIYQIQNNEEELVKITYLIMLAAYDFADYLYLKNNKSILNFPEIKKKIFANSSNVFKSRNNQAKIFYIRLLIEEKETDQLQRRLVSWQSLEPFVNLFSELMNLGKENLLRQICFTEINFSWSTDLTHIVEIRKLIKENYSIQEIMDFKHKNKLTYSFKILQPILDDKV